MSEQPMTLHVLVGCPFCTKCIMMAKICNIDFQMKIYTHKKELKTDEYLHLNPTAAAPTLVCDEGVLTDSEAIVRYFGYRASTSNILGATSFEIAQVDLLRKE